MFVKDSKKRITADQIMKTPYIMNAISQFIKQQGKLQQYAIPIQNQSISTKPSQTQSQHQEEEDTMKTINSVVERTGNKVGETLQISRTLTVTQRLKLKKEEQARKRQQQLKQYTKNTAAQRTFAKDLKQRNLGQTGQFGKTQAKTLQIKAQQYNKARSEIKFKSRELEKMQTINLEELSNTLMNLTVKEQTQQDFEQVPLPGNSSYIPINEDKTMKKSTPIKQQDRPIVKRQEKTIKIQPVKQTKKQQQIAEQIYEEDELEQYYDDDFEEYQEEPEGEKQKKQENILAYFENELGASNLSPTKRQKVSNAFKPLGQSSVHTKVQYLEQQCEALVGPKRFAQLIKLFKEGKIDIQRDKAKYTDKQKKVIFNIEEIQYYDQ